MFSCLLGMIYFVSGEDPSLIGLIKIYFAVVFDFDLILRIGWRICFCHMCFIFTYPVLHHRPECAIFVGNLPRVYPFTLVETGIH